MVATVSGYLSPIRLPLSIDGSGCGMTRGAEVTGDAGGKRNKANSYSCISRGTYDADDGGGYMYRGQERAAAPHTRGSGAHG